MEPDSSSTGPTLPQPHEISRREKEDAMGAYLMMFAAWGAGLPLPILNLIAAIIYFFINKKSSPFVAFHSYQSLLTQIPISLLNAGVIIWGALIVSPVLKYTKYFWVYVIFVALWNILYMVFSIIACIQARKGRFYYFWVFGRIAFAQYFGTRAVARAARVERNIAPEGY